VARAGLFSGFFSGSSGEFPEERPEIHHPGAYLAFFTSIATRALHRGHWTFTALADRFRLASRIPIYVHA
jgi:hypothetical protein